MQCTGNQVNLVVKDKSDTVCFLKYMQDTPKVTCLGQSYSREMTAVV